MLDMFLCNTFITLSPYRCSARTADGTLKRSARSKTMNVEEVTTFYECVRSIIKYFQCSCLGILELGKMYLLSWCSSRMAHFMDACHVLENMVVALYDATFTQSIQKEERDSLFSPEILFILKLITDVRKCFKNGYLRKVDKSNALVSCAYGIAHTTSSEISSPKAPKADVFLDSLEFDGNGNLLSKITINGTSHSILLNKHHKSSRGKSQEEVLALLKESLNKLKHRILTNIKENINDQCGEDTFYYCWSALDQSDKSSTEERCIKMKDLLTILCTEKAHTIKQYKSKKEDDV